MRRPAVPTGTPEPREAPDAGAPRRRCSGTSIPDPAGRSPALASPGSSRPRRALDSPAANVALFAFLVNYPWEFLQVPLFRNMAAAPHWEAVKVCTSATLGDAAIAVVAFWGVAAAARTRRWILRPSAVQVAGFVAIGLAITLALEWLATGPLGRWEYAEAMPVLPLLGVGLAPALQWILLPPLVAWFVRRQLT